MFFICLHFVAEMLKTGFFLSYSQIFIYLQAHPQYGAYSASDIVIDRVIDAAQIALLRIVPLNSYIAVAVNIRSLHLPPSRGAEPPPPDAV